MMGQLAAGEPTASLAQVAEDGGQPRLRVALQIGIQGSQGFPEVFGGAGGGREQGLKSGA